MKTVEIRGIRIGEGRPKICVPIVEETMEAICQAAEQLIGQPWDILEWRADHYEDVMNVEGVTEVLQRLRDILGDKPILFTFRSEEEGGARHMEPEIYGELLTEVAQTGLVDLIDVEGYMGDKVPRTKEIFEGHMVPVCLIRKLHKCDVKVIVSNHDFDGTPDKEDIINRLCFMQELGADVTKIAVMPKSSKDVLTLLAATEAMQRKYATCPVVTMSMSGNGVISRLCGELFGSALTFGSAGKASAPGQMDIQELHRILDLLHKNMEIQ